MRNVGVVASDHACDQKLTKTGQKKRQETKEREKKEVIFKSMTHDSLWP